jgi:hypothetical protein
MSSKSDRLVQVTLGVTTWIDPTDPTLVDTVLNRRGGTIAIVVCEQVQSNLESLPYVVNARVTERPRETGKMTVKFFPNDKGNPPGKLADAELHFSGGPLDGLKLVGFAVWERKSGGRNVTFPARQYTVNGERRSYALLRPISDATTQDRLRDLVLDAFIEHEAQVARI